MRIITAEGEIYEINEDKLEPNPPIQLSISIGIPGSGQFSKPFTAMYDPGAVGPASVVLPLALLQELGLADKLPLLNVSQAELADGSVDEEELGTMIALRIMTIPNNRPIVFDGIRCSVSQGAGADGTLIGASVLRYFHAVVRESALSLLTLSAKLPTG